MSNNTLPKDNVSDLSINLMGAISRCTILRLKLQEIKNQFPRNIFDNIVVTQVTANSFSEAFNYLMMIIDNLNNHSSSDIFVRANYIVQGEQYLQIARNYVKQIQAN